MVDVTVNAPVFRDVTAGSLWLVSSATVSSSAVTAASASGAKPTQTGEAQDADQQAQKEMDDNQATSGLGIGLPSSQSTVSQGNGTAGSQSGQSSDGVGVGAAVSVNWVTVESRSIVPEERTIRVAGMFALLSSAHVDAKAHATGKAFPSGTTAVGAGVSLNVATVDDLASLGAGADVVAG